MENWEEIIENWFTYHAPTPEQVVTYGEIRSKAKEFAILLIQVVPDGPDRLAALRKLRETVMTANAGIACNE